ncbi:hypothetical protein [Plantactinospora sp. B24E8]|uniref:hypothetical protein n=1 Tax=Plantactinospora sp. B24E8 TaxID=3153567 RepID=UPI00325F3A6D
MIIAGFTVVTLRSPGDTAVPPFQQAETTNGDVVLRPIAYEIPDGAPAAGQALRDLASTIGSTSYDGNRGTYAYHHLRSWGSTRALGPGDRNMSLAQEMWTWSDANGVGESRVRELQPEFPDEESRQYWQEILGKNGVQPAATTSVVTSSGTVGPTKPVDPAALPITLQVEAGAPEVAKAVNGLYRSHVVPLETRKKIIQTIAAVPGFQWRGTVTDRSGRTGVAVTTDDEEHDVQLVLVFDRRTGELLAHENVRLSGPRQVLAYNLFLEYGYRSSTD